MEAELSSARSEAKHQKNRAELLANGRGNIGGDVSDKESQVREVQGNRDGRHQGLQQKSVRVEKLSPDLENSLKRKRGLDTIASSVSAREAPQVQSTVALSSRPRERPQKTWGVFRETIREVPQKLLPSGQVWQELTNEEKEAHPDAESVEMAYTALLNPKLPSPMFCAYFRAHHEAYCLCYIYRQDDKCKTTTQATSDASLRCCARCIKSDKPCLWYDFDVHELKLLAE